MCTTNTSLFLTTFRMMQLSQLSLFSVLAKLSIKIVKHKVKPLKLKVHGIHNGQNLRRKTVGAPYPPY